MRRMFLKRSPTFGDYVVRDSRDLMQNTARRLVLLCDLDRNAVHHGRICLWNIENANHPEDICHERNFGNIVHALEYGSTSCLQMTKHSLFAI